jgi:hypothetical protein
MDNSICTNYRDESARPGILIKSMRVLVECHVIVLTAAYVRKCSLRELKYFDVNTMR